MILEMKEDRHELSCQCNYVGMGIIIWESEFTVHGKIVLYYCCNYRGFLSLVDQIFSFFSVFYCDIYIYIYINIYIYIYIYIPSVLLFYSLSRFFLLHALVWYIVLVMHQLKILSPCMRIVEMKRFTCNIGDICLWHAWRLFVSIQIIITCLVIIFVLHLNMEKSLGFCSLSLIMLHPVGRSELLRHSIKGDISVCLRV
jgi:hypothetical protein